MKKPNKSENTQRFVIREEGLKYYQSPMDETEIHLVNEDTFYEAQSLLLSCEHCAPDAEVSFDFLIDELTGCDPTRTEYVLPRVARCPHCGHSVTEKTLIVPLS